MGEGFRVDLAALTRAAEGVRETIHSMNSRRVSDLDCPAGAFGHERLAGIVEDFCQRWDRGVGNLADDAEEISGRLTQCAAVYRETDEAARANVEGIVQRPAGVDPAAD